MAMVRICSSTPAHVPSMVFFVPGHGLDPKRDPKIEAAVSPIPNDNIPLNNATCTPEIRDLFTYCCLHDMTGDISV